MSTQTGNPIKFFFLNDITLKERNRLKKYLHQLFKREGKPLDFVNYIFCSDKYLLDINKNYLHHNYYTDIITFDLSDDKQKVKAEIYISTDRVRDNAGRLGLSLKSELHRVIFHGALHLCGYRDKKVMEKTIMRKMENLHLGKYLKRVPRDTVSG